MDILEILKAEHRQVDSLWKEAQNETVEQKTLQLYQKIKNELQSHMETEQAVFYSKFLKYPEFQDIIDESFKEHKKADDLLHEVDELARKSEFDRLDDRFDTLMKLIEHHVQTEETKLFPMVRKVMRSNERVEYGRHYMAAKEEKKLAA